MIKELKIAHIILIEQASITFDGGFTALSGETGAGKSAIMEALRLVLGARTDTKLIRHGQDKALVTALFDLSRLPKAKHFLFDKGIDGGEDPDLLIISREIHASGKTRAHINHQPVQLGILKELSAYLLEVVGQHSNHRLFDLDEHRKILDLFGSYQPLLSDYKKTYLLLETLKKELDTLKKEQPGSLREMERTLIEISEIEEAALKEGEEESLFETYSFMASAKERQSSLEELLLALEGDHGVLPLLKKAKSAYNQLNELDPSLKEDLTLFPQVMIEIEELIHSLSKAYARQEVDPAKLDKLQKRLTLIERLKRKYGTTLGEIFAYCQSSKERLHHLQNLEKILEEKQEAYELLHRQVEALACQLSCERKKCSLEFSEKTSAILHALNMKGAELFIEITPIALSASGTDRIEFFLYSNVGEKQIALKEGASGGELARVLLAHHILLAGKESIGTLIFDEIDANIGGTTAALIGEHLKALSQSFQIICITHFPQMAISAHQHLQIAKQVQKGRTFSQIKYIAEEERSQELARMTGS